MFKSDLYMARKSAHTETVGGSELLVPLTTDKGMCGGVNANVIRRVKAEVVDRDLSKIKIMSIGGKGAGALARPFPNTFKVSLEDISAPYNFPTIMAIAENIQKQGEGYDKISIFYN
jgi:F-type H+-transporting ATPase subunit gamma